MNKEKAKQRLEALMEEAKKLEAIINAPEKALRLEVNEFHNLFVSYGEYRIGFISNRGECRILNQEEWVNTYNQWRKDGKPVDSTPVEWRGKEYIINVNLSLECNSVSSGLIYNFGNCSYFQSCEDDNIKRFEHNLKAIGY